jgi:nucleoside-diphosphate-sugar epimerase
MKYKKILLTGASGKLGTEISNSGYFQSLLKPSSEIFDITDKKKIENFFNKNDFDAVLHCAALARMGECEKDPAAAANTNTIGTSNLVSAVIEKEKKSDKKIRFIQISTDGVYASTKGNYSEQDATIPYNVYGWTKLGAECAVHLLSNYCIIRTRFFDPESIPFEESATDAFTSGVPVEYVAKSIKILLESDFIGTINVGGERKSDYEKYKEFKKSIKPCKFKDIAKSVNFHMARDASMDISLWKKIEKSNGKQ